MSLCQQPRKIRNSTPSLIHCADLVLPWLNPEDLANLSLSSKSLRRIAAAISAARRSDAAGGAEAHPIPFVGSLRYSFFIYSPSSLRYPFRRPWPCVSTTPTASKRRVSVRLKIVWDVNKAWCLFASEFIPKNTFVCEYAGELLTTDEARKRQQNYDQLSKNGNFSPALLVVREHLPSRKACLRLNIDATRVGNVARFINHSCDGGNLDTVLVRSPGNLVPHLCFFASKDIEDEEELTFSYGECGPGTEGSRCYCGTSSCFGFLPSEET